MSKTQLRFQNMSGAAVSRIAKRLAQKAPHVSQRHGFQAEAARLRPLLRAGHIALGFLRGRPITAMELPYRPKSQGHVTSKGLTRSQPDWVLIEELVEKHGQEYFSDSRELQQKFAEFKSSALPA